MFHPDFTVECYEVHDEVTCPTCGTVERDVEDVLGVWDTRDRPPVVTWHFRCEACSRCWEETDRLDEPG